MPNQHAALDDPLRGKKSGKWSKYGGSVSGLVKERIEDTWFCQVCGDEVPKEFKPFMIEMFPGDFIRICNGCTHTVSKTEYSIERTIQIVRVKRD